MIKRHEVQVLLAAGFTQQQVVKATGVSKRSVTRIAEERPVQGLEETGVAAERRVGRRSTVEDFRSELNAWLEEDPDLPTVELLHRLRQRGYKGGKTAVYDWVRRLRGPAPTRVIVLRGAARGVRPVRLRGGSGSLSFRPHRDHPVRRLPAEVRAVGLRGAGPEPAGGAPVSIPVEGVRGLRRRAPPRRG
jgi:transposase